MTGFLAKFSLPLFVFASALFTSGSSQDDAIEPNGEAIAFFENEIRPILAENCLDCHTGTKAKVGLQLNHRAGWLKGSDYRKVVNLENPSESVVVKAISHTGGRDIIPMPYEDEKIPDDSIAKLTKWIELGLPWPEYEKTEFSDPSEHWSFQQVIPPVIPEEAGHPIDFFLQRARKEKGLVDAEKADRPTLHRRASLGLLGLPPTYEEAQKFLTDSGPDEIAWPQLVDELLASPRYGERWARHWMDVARYSDTKGYEAAGRERRFVYSFTYRDWLIRAFNDDMPYDQFLRYQLAAEQLVDWKSAEKEHLAALGFLSLSKNGKTELVIDDRLDTTFRGMMALTVACARCHDHKFDPISTKEYYGLYSVFQNSQKVEKPTIGEEKSGPEYETYLKELGKKQKVVDDFLAPHFARIEKEHPELAGRFEQLKAKLDRATRRELMNKQRVVDKFVADSAMESAKAIVLTDHPKPAEQKVFIRGNPGRRGEVAPRQFLSYGKDIEPAVFTQGSGRLEMAKQIATKDNPLTARNIVNRVWMWHFGEGIVRSVDDFGIQGEFPDHPELLDWLATWFVENGWSIKKLHKLILTSETWQQASRNDAEAANMVIDPENRFLWKFNKRRLDLEQLRDSLLFATGSLSDEMFGPAVKILEPPYSNRRSVYAFIDRQNLNPVFRNFDFSNPQETTAKRPSTTIPMQALFTLNSEFVQDQSLALSKKGEDKEDPVQFYHRSVFGKDPGEQDRILADSFLTAFESELDEYGTRQTNSEWSYGYGEHVDNTARVRFTAFPHWTGERWQISKEHPLKNNPLSYLYANKGATHPGYTSKESAIYQWHSPDDIEVEIKGLVERSSVGKGNGVRVKIVSSESGEILDFVMNASKKAMNATVPKLSVKENEKLFFIVEPHENNASFDSVRWSPQVIDRSGRWPKWGLAESFSGPATPATSHSAYVHALLNTNRFLFIE